jgi:Zn-dependent protease
MQDIIYNIAIGFPGFLFAIVFHEWAHARMALYFGDETAMYQGRLSLNPAVHADPIGTLLFPLIGAATGGVMFGWARPVPVDPRRFKNHKAGIFWVSFAGPLANIILAIVSALGFALAYHYLPTDFAYRGVLQGMLRSSLLINLVLAVFNLLPIPPLDGSKMVTTFLDYNQARKYEELGKYSFILILVLWMTNALSYLMYPALVLGTFVLNLFMNLLA